MVAALVLGVIAVVFGLVTHRHQYIVVGLVLVITGIVLAAVLFVLAAVHHGIIQFTGPYGYLFGWLFW